MTFSASSGKVTYDGDGATTAFPTTFKFILNAHVKAVLRDALDVETIWVEATDYTLTGAGVAGGGTVTATVAPATGETLVIILDVPFTQQKNFPIGGSFPTTQVEEMGDLAAMGLAKLNEVDNRTFKVPETDTQSGADLDIPIDSVRANKFLAFDGAGKAIAAAGTTGGLSPVSAFMDTLLPSADAATARATLVAAGTGADNAFSGINSYAKIQKWGHGANVGSAGVLTLGDDGNSFIVTGATAVTSIAAKGVGTIVVLSFASALTLTHAAADLILPGAANILTTAGDVAIFEEYAAGDWRCLSYQRADGKALVESAVGSTTGDAKLTLKTTPDAGWVMVDDGTIGSASSGASNRANADTENLFTLMWDNIIDTWAPVSGGRGASAAADFAADKTITLPLMLGRALGISGAGASLTTRALGENLGAETHQLTIAEMPSHDHNVAARDAGGSSSIGTGAGTIFNITTDSRGGGTAHPNMQPSAFLNLMIKL